MYCEKCGKELQEGVLICGYCGHSIPKDKLSRDTLQSLKEQEYSDESLKPNTGASVRMVGIALIVIGIICDIGCMFLIGSGGFEAFQTFIIMGTICFFIGLVLTFSFRG